MERYSRLCQIPLNGSGASARELGRSKELNTFLRQLGIMDTQAGLDAVVQELADFRKLSDLDAQPDGSRPMLIRYSPIELSGRPGWASDVMPFLALCGCGMDSTGAVYHHTFFFRPGLLLNSGGFNYLDHLFGTRFADPDQSGPDDLDRDPDRVEPILRAEDALLVKLAAAALLKDRCIVLKLEKDCDFNRRAMDLLSQIYSLLPPALAIRTGFSSYQDPRQLTALMRSTPIRIFLTHADCSCSAADNQYLFFDLNQPVNLQVSAQQAKDFQVSKNFFTYLTYWHSMPWQERQPLMELLFSGEKHLPNEQSYSAVTRSFVREPFIQWINRLPDRGTYTSLEQLKEKYDSFPICERVPVLREKFFRAVPELLKQPLTVDALAGDLRARLNATAKDAEGYEQLQALSAFSQLLLAACAAPAARGSHGPQSAPAQSAPALQEAHAKQLQEMEHSFMEKLSQLSEENQALRKAHEAERCKLEQDFTWKLHELEQAAAEKLLRLDKEHDALRSAHEAERCKLEQDFTWKLHEMEQSAEEKLSRLTHENQTLRTERDQLLKKLANADISGEMRQKLEQDFTWRLHEAEQAFEKKLSQLNGENLALRKAQAADLEKLEQSYAAQIAQLRSEAEATQNKLRLSWDKISNLIKERDQVLEQQEQTIALRISEAVAAHQDVLEKSHAEELARRDAESQSLQDALKDLADSHAADLAALKQEHAAQIAQLRSETETTQNKLRLSWDKISNLIKERDQILEQQEQTIALRIREVSDAFEKGYAEELARRDAESQSLQDALKDISDSHAAELDALKQEHAAQQEKLAQLHGVELLELADSHAADLAALKQEHAAQIDQLRSEAETTQNKLRLSWDKISNLIKERDQVLEQQEQTIALRISEAAAALEKRHAEELARRDTESRYLREELLDLTDSQTAELEKLTQHHAEELARRDAESQSLRDALQARADSHAAELTALKQKHAQELSSADQALSTAKQDLDTAKRSHAHALEQAKQKYVAAFNELRSGATDRIHKLQAENAQLRAELEQAGPQTRVAPTASDPDVAALIRAAVEEERSRLTGAHQLSLAEANDEISRLRAELARQQTSAPQPDLAEAVAGVRRELEKKHQADIDQANEAIRRLTQDHAQKLEAMQAKYHDDIDQTNEAIRRMTRDHTQELEDMARKFKDDLEAANSTIKDLVLERNQLIDRSKKLETEKEMTDMELQWCNEQLRDARAKLEQLDTPLTETPSKPDPTPGGKRTSWWKK